MGQDFVIDERLLAESFELGELDLCSVHIVDDRRFAWVLLVPRQKGLRELYELSRGQRALLMEEIAQVSEALEGVSGCDKINVAALGNQVAQLHIHIIARNEGDAAWPDPVWGKGVRDPYKRDEKNAIMGDLARALSLQERKNVV